MGTIIFLILICMGFAFVLLKLSRPSSKKVGKTTGVCVEVKLELVQNRGTPYNRQLRGMDSRSYRPYVKYTWEQKEYIARSFQAYSRALFFPGDKVNIYVYEDKSVIKIIR